MKTLFPELDTPSTLKELKAEWKDCKLCEFWPARTQVVFWDGSETSEVMFVGQYPGKDEDKTGKCYTGKPGKLCRRCATKIAGIPEDMQFWTNSLCCRPPGDVKASWVKSCKNLLNHQIDIVEPKLIVAMGKMALKNLDKHLAKHPMSEVHGETFYYRNIPSICVTFPAAYLRQVTEEQKLALGRIIREDFEKVGSYYRCLKNQSENTSRME